MSQERIEELEKMLADAAEGYYNLEPKMDDQEYDARKAELEFLRPASPVVAQVGVAVSKTSVWDKVEHTIPMGSLDKVNSRDGFFTWAEGTGTEEFLLTQKIDGSSMELVYSGGSLVRAVTRGDGAIGEDVTFNVRQIPGIPHVIAESGDVSVRGEVVMYKDVFQKEYSGEYANPRNTANGKVREKKGGGADCKNLNFIAYNLYVDGNLPATEQGQFDQLRELGFEVPFYEVGNMFDLAQTFDTVKVNREVIPYEIDGMVVRVNDMVHQDGLGSKAMRPNGQTAWKFDAAMATTKVIDIRWQVGNSGRVTPVAAVEPVNIGGVTITSISLHNMAMFRKLKLSAGCEVLVARRNDVIPYIEKNITAGVEAA